MGLDPIRCDRLGSIVGMSRSMRGSAFKGGIAAAGGGVGPLHDIPELSGIWQERAA